MPRPTRTSAGSGVASRHAPGCGGGQPPRRRHHRPQPRPARGAALLIAMVLLTVVATLASGMVWQQWRSVEVETAERARSQTGWILTGALDWARLILREDMRGDNATHDDLKEAWATPLAEARLSTFLAADRSNNADSDLEAFLGGSISDAQSRYNLRNLVVDAKLVPAQVQLLERLCSAAGLPPSLAGQIASQWLAALSGTDAAAALLPQQLADLVWFGLDAAMLERLAPLVVVLPRATPVNLNTAPREVLAAVLPTIGLGGADRLAQARPFKTLADVAAVLGANVSLEAAVVDVKSSFFEVRGRIRLGDRMLEEQSLVERRSGPQVVAIQRQRRALAGEAGR